MRLERRQPDNAVVAVSRCQRGTLPAAGICNAVQTVQVSQCAPAGQCHWRKLVGSVSCCTVHDAAAAGRAGTGIAALQRSAGWCRRPGVGVRLHCQ